MALLKPFSLNSRSVSSYASSVEKIPIAAPPSTSEHQWRLAMTRNMPVVAAIPYPATLIQGLIVSPYSLCNICAAMKAVAVCPEGYELKALPSGRSLFMICLVGRAMRFMMAIDPISAVIIRRQSLRPSTPKAFIA